MRPSRTLVLFFCTVLQASAAILAEWNFNSDSIDDDAATGSLAVSQGEGSFALLSATATFGSVGRGATSDPAPSDNTQLSMRGLPKMDEANKSAGVELSYSTVGFEQISLSWDQYNSRTASRYWRVQYSIDGFTWNDHRVITNASASRWQRFTVNLSDVPMLNDVSFATIRIAQEFESTATGAGRDAYAAVDPDANYSTAGSCWLDMITISGRPIGETNSIPTIEQIADIQLDLGETSPGISIALFDKETPPEQLAATALSSNEEIATVESLELNGTNRVLVLRAISIGEAVIAIQVVDQNGDSSEMTFTVRVVSVTETPNFFAAWNFNSAPPDDDVATGAFEPSIGLGQFQVLATDNLSFGSVGQSRTSDPAELDDSMLRLSGFPPQGTGEATCGIEIFASTAGRSNITLVWDQYNSSSASRYWLVQYTTNAAEFIDFALVTNSAASSWTRARAIHFQDVAGVNDNPHFGIRLVSEFGPEGEFVAAGRDSNYSPVGTLWLDMLGFTGDPLRIDVTPPQLRITLAREIKISWPITAPDYHLESRQPSESEWVPVNAELVETGTEFQVRLDAADASRLFRLRK